MGSTPRSCYMPPTVCAILSATVATPRILTPPNPFRISTAFTGAGTYDSDDIRF